MAKPIVGVNCDLDTEGTGRQVARPYLFLYTDYFDAVTKAGGIPLLLPFLENPQDIKQTLFKVDALILTGGADVDPDSYGCKNHQDTRKVPARRQKFDLALARISLSLEIPVLGICMGMQMLNIAAGGTLRQDLCDSDQTRRHRNIDKADQEIHQVDIIPETCLARIVGDTRLDVNSTHHHSVDKIAPGFNICAKAGDGIVEAIEKDDGPLVLGVQWHPERLVRYKLHLKLFENLIKTASA